MLTWICSRWDTHQHRLADVPVPGNEHIMVPGQDYSNPRVKDFANGNTGLFGRTIPATHHQVDS